MPITPYHFGPSGFVGLVFRKWLDIPVFILANVVVDIEVLLYDRLPMHRHAHTLLIGAAIGALWGIAAYPIRPLFKKLMNIFLLPYQSTFFKMVISGILGVWLHVLIDAVFHRDVLLFWPNRARPLYGLISREQVQLICLVFFVPAFILYAFTVVSYVKKKKPKRTDSE